MARDYGKVKSTYWTGQTGRQLCRCGKDAVILGAYLQTCAASNMIGLYHLPIYVIVHDTPLTTRGVAKALASLSEAGFAHYDTDTEIVFVPEMAAYQIAPTLKPNDNRVKSVVKHWNEHRKSRFYLDFYQRYRKSYHLPKPISDRGLEGASKGLRSQEQEQEQEQEQLDLRCISLEELEPNAYRLFKKLGYNGNEGTNLWRIAAAEHCRLLSQADVADAVQGCKECLPLNRPAYLYTTLENRLSKDGIDLRQLLGRIQPDAPWPTSRSREGVPQET